MTDSAATVRWSGRQIAALLLLILAGVAIRVVLLPTQGLKGDLDQFVLWVHGISTGGLGNAYDQNRHVPAGHGLHLGNARRARACVPDRD